MELQVIFTDLFLFPYFFNSQWTHIKFGNKKKNQKILKYFKNICRSFHLDTVG